MIINNIPKRHFYNNKEYILDFQKKIMILNKDFHNLLLSKKLWNKFGFKKIGGSSVGDVLRVDNFKSDFAAFCRICWCDMPILDKKFINAGIAIEPKVIKVLESHLNVEIKTFPPSEYNYDYFSNKDEIIGGIPDGYIESKKIILEIKTTKENNYDNWNMFGIPPAYLKQAQIYTYLMGVEKFWIVATFLKEEDYINPESYPIENRKVKNYKFLINKEQVEDDILKIKTWYNFHTLEGKSPQWDEVKDKDLIDYLKCENEEQYIALLQKWKNEGKFVD